MHIFSTFVLVLLSSIMLHLVKEYWFDLGVFALANKNLHIVCVCVGNRHEDWFPINLS